MSEPKISVIIPVYNVEKYISRLIKSLLNQSYKNFELILLNDGSTDNTLNELIKFDDERIVLIDKKNTGVSDTRNEGLKKVTGDLLTFVDSDDFVSPDYFDTLIKIFNNYDIDLINFGFYSEVEDEKFNIISSDIINYEEKLYPNKDAINLDLVNLWDNTMLYNIWNKVYKVDIIKKYKIKFINENWGEDVIFNRDYLNVISTLYNSNKCFYHYIKERKGSITGRYNKELFKIRKKEYYDFIDYFEANGIAQGQYIEFVSRRFVDRVLGCIENICGSSIINKEKIESISVILNDKLLSSTIKNVKKHSIKTKILLLPIKLKLKRVTFYTFNLVSFIRKKFPHIFNKLKNSR